MSDDHTESAAGTSGSDRAFGLVFAALFAFIALYPLLKGASVRWWALVLGTGFLGFAVAKPRSLRMLNRLWMRLGAALHCITSPVAVFLVYAVALVPTALVLRALNKDPLRLRADRHANTYWIDRAPPGRADAQMKKQF